MFGNVFIRGQEDKTRSMVATFGFWEVRNGNVYSIGWGFPPVKPADVKMVIQREFSQDFEYFDYKDILKTVAGVCSLFDYEELMVCSRLSWYHRLRIWFDTMGQIRRQYYRVIFDFYITVDAKGFSSYGEIQIFNHNSRVIRMWKWIIGLIDSVWRGPETVFIPKVTFIG